MARLNAARYYVVVCQALEDVLEYGIPRMRLFQDHGTMCKRAMFWHDTTDLYSGYNEYTDSRYDSVVRVVPME